MNTVSTLTHNLQQTASRYPENCAYKFGDNSISYSELLRKAQSLATYLESKGTCRGDRVGILCHKSLDLVIAVYGILFAGCSYVPIDTTSPKARIDAIVEQCSVSFLIGNSSLLEKVCLKNGSFLKTDSGCEWNTALTQGEYNKPEISNDDLAYIIFTSGSTGTPKGIVHTHASACAFASMMSEHFTLTPGDRLIGISPLQFDMSTFDLFAADVVGACTVLASEAHLKMPASLTALVEKENITIWYSTPYSLIQSLQYGAIDQRVVNSLRWIIYGGEAFPVSMLKPLMAVLQQARFSNVYGPAELNVCHIFDIPQGSVWQKTEIPIGKPCKNVNTKILDGNGNNHSIGELWVSAPTMMKEYWNAEAKTENTIKCDSNGVRFYRTGDLVELDQEGLFSFKGRSDRQIKLRGFRVELGEIENELSLIPGIAQACVVVNRDTSQSELAAHIVIEKNQKLTSEQIKNSLSQKLPRYAVPTKFLKHKAFPVTSSGKTDSQTLDLSKGKIHA